MRIGGFVVLFGTRNYCTTQRALAVALAPALAAPHDDETIQPGGVSLAISAESHMREADTPVGTSIFTIVHCAGAVTCEIDGFLVLFGTRI